MVRFANSLKDKNEALKMWSQCFTDSTSYVNYYFSKRYKNSNFLLNERDEKILGGLHLNPYTFNFYGNCEKSFYLVGVGVYPEHRGQGVFGELMNEVFKISKKRGVREIFLHPINSEIYKGFDFAFTHYINEYRADLDKLFFDMELDVINKFGYESGAEIVEVTADSLKPIEEELLEFINEMSLNYSSSLIKNSRDLKKQLDELNFENGHFYMLKIEDEIVGTFSYTPEGKNLIIRDLQFENLEYLYDIFKFLRRFADYYEKAIFRTPLNLGLELFMKNSEKVEKVEIPFMMTKIIDKERVLNEFFQNLELDDCDEFEIDIQIEDENAYENFKWKNNFGRLKKFPLVRSREEREKDREEDRLRFEIEISDTEDDEFDEDIELIETDWCTLTKIVYGSLDVETARKMELLDIEEESEIYQKLKNLKIKRGFILEYV